MNVDAAYSVAQKAAYASEQATTSLAVAFTNALGASGQDSAASLSVPIPFENDIVIIEDTVVAGTTHVDDIDEIVCRLSDGQKLRFERDPDNPYDKWAIRVFFKSSRIGFLSATENSIIAHLMDGGKNIYGVFTGCEKAGNWNKVHMEVHFND